MGGLGLMDIAIGMEVALKCEDEFPDSEIYLTLEQSSS